MRESYYKEIFRNIGENKSFCIIGTGAIALEITDFINKNLNNCKVTLYVDSKAIGTLNDIPIVKPYELKNLKDQFDVVIISTISAKNLFVMYLKLMNITNYITLDKKIINSPNKIVCPEKIESIFESKEDRKLFDIISKARIKQNSLPVIEYVRNSKVLEDKISAYTTRQYMDFINKDEIKVVLDCGACELFHSLYFKSQFKNIEKIYAFEPSNCMTETIANFVNMDNVIELVPKGLWNEETTLSFRKDFDCSGASNLEVVAKRKIANEQIINVNLTTIDNFVKERNISKVDFIKMDVENAELKALEGAYNTIVEHRPQMAISIYHSNEQFYGIPPLLNKWLENYVFKLGHYTERDDLAETILYAIPKEIFKKNYNLAKA
jgi:FkbM family methyltransferase